MSPAASNWFSVLNEHSEWRSDADIQRWFAVLTGKTKVNLSPSALNRLKNALCQMRNTVYDRHFGRKLDLAWLKVELAQMKLSFDDEMTQPGIPIFRAESDINTDDGLLDSLLSALLLQFAAELADCMSSNSEVNVQRCEGLYRDARADNITMVPEVSDGIETLWRSEIPVLKEKSLESQFEIQRCADLFPASSRSKYCSDSCRFSTFQIIKQLKEPDYLKEKQRRYRQKKL